MAQLHSRYEGESPGFSIEEIEVVSEGVEGWLVGQDGLLQ